MNKEEGWQKQLILIFFQSGNGDFQSCCLEFNHFRPNLWTNWCKQEEIIAVSDVSQWEFDLHII